MLLQQEARWVAMARLQDRGDTYAVDLDTLGPREPLRGLPRSGRAIRGSVFVSVCPEMLDRGVELRKQVG